VWYEPKRFGYVALALNGPAQEVLKKALLDAFPNFGALNSLIAELNFAPGRFSALDFSGTIANLVTAARAEGWDGNLILEARLSNPGNLEIQKVAARYFSGRLDLIEGSAAPSAVNISQAGGFRTLQRVVKDKLGFLQMQTFLESYTKLSRQICKVEVVVGNKVESGTGFLVGPDVVLTNYHVIEDLLSAKGGPASVTCRFDYLGVEGKVRTGHPVPLSKNAAFPIAWAEPSKLDTLADDGGQTPKEDELDYALLQLEGATGDDAILSHGEVRGYVTITDPPDPAKRPELFAQSAPLVIVQHPDGGPMSVAIDTEGVIGLNGNNTRLRYRTNTDEGSSGSPCCSMELVPMALHHAGDPKFAFRYKPQFNQGIPLCRIVEHIIKTFPVAAQRLG
jgi:hypothetical protein